MKKILVTLLTLIVILPIFSIIVFQAKTASLPPIGYWKFDEGSGNIAYDSSGNGNDGTVHGPQWTNGINGNALWFDGVDDHVEVPYADSLNITVALTIEAWTKPVAFSPPEYGIIVNKGETWALIVNETGFLWADVITDSTRQWVNSTEPLVGDAWQHVTMIFNGTVVKLYLNGNEVASQACPGTLKSDTLNLMIGANSPSPDTISTFKGTIDEVKIYNYSRTAEEILQDYQTWGAVGGIYIPVNKLELLAPYIGLTILLAVTVMTVGYVKKRKKHTETS